MQKDPFSLINGWWCEKSGFVYLARPDKLPQCSTGDKFMSLSLERYREPQMEMTVKKGRKKGDCVAEETAGPKLLSRAFFVGVTRI